MATNVDGDLYVIRSVRNFPILWQDGNARAVNNKEQNLQLKEDQRKVWISLAKQLRLKDTFIRERWLQLRTRFLYELEKGINDGTDFQYFDEMLFLVNSEYTNKTEIMENKLRNNEIKGEDAEFIITQDELEMLDDDEEYNESNVFIELSEEEHYIESVNEQKLSSKSKRKLSKDIATTKKIKTEKMTEEYLNDEPTNEHDSKKIKFEINDNQNDELLNDLQNDDKADVKTIALITNTHLKQEDFAEEPVEEKPTVLHQPSHQNHHVQTKKIIESDDKPESRSEDAIFLELVSVMLNKMNPTDKKRVKKEIMNILLS